MKSFVLFTASLLVLGFATLAASFGTNEMLESCKLTKEKDGPLMECLAVQRQYQHQEIEKVRSQSVKNYTGFRLLIDNTSQCFPEDQKEKEHCYITVLSQRLSQQMIHMNHVPFPSDATILYYWFRSHKLTMLNRCGFDRINSPEIFSCIDDYGLRADEIIESKILDTYEAYERMLSIIRVFKFCYRSVRVLQGDCLRNQHEAFKRKTTDDFKQKKELMLHKLGTCDISKNIIEGITGCIKPLDDELIYFAFEMLEEPGLGRFFLDVWKEREVCIQQSPEIMKCLETMPAIYDHLPPTPPSIQYQYGWNLFLFDDIITGLVGYITSASRGMLTECGITQPKNPEVYVCLPEDYKTIKTDTWKAPETAFIKTMKLMNESAECFTSVSEAEATCLYKKKQDMMKNINIKGKATTKSTSLILHLCNFTPEIGSCFKSKITELKKLANIMLYDPSIAEEIWKLGTSLKGCLREPAVKKCVLDMRTLPEKIRVCKMHTIQYTDFL